MRQTFLRERCMVKIWSAARLSNVLWNPLDRPEYRIRVVNRRDNVTLRGEVLR